MTRRIGLLREYDFHEAPAAILLMRFQARAYRRAQTRGPHDENTR